MERKISNAHNRNFFMKKPDYMGFCLELANREANSLPIDRNVLIELASKYNTPLPGTVEWAQEGLEFIDSPETLN